MKTFLKVKTQTLAAEARIIRRLERNAKRRYGGEHGLFKSLYQHRIGVVRSAARNHHLALGFLRGRSYRQMEDFARSTPDWQEIERQAIRFAGEEEQVVKQRFAEWLGEAKAHAALFPAEAVLRVAIRHKKRQEREAAKEAAE